MDIDTEVRGARLGWFHYRLAVVLGCVLFVDGYDLFNAGYIAPYLRREWVLDDRQIGLILSTGVAGLAIGAYLQAPIAKWIGRRATVVLGTAMLSCVSLMIAGCVRDYVAFLSLRLILGIALGMLSPLAFVYLNEWAPAHIANRFASLSFVIPFSLGGIAAGGAAMLLGPHIGWRGLYCVAAIGLPISAACLLTLPESFVRLIKRGRIDEIRSVLIAARPERTALYNLTDDFRLPAMASGNGAGFSALFASNRRWTTLGIWAASALSLLSLHGISGWLPTMLVANGQAFASAFGYGTLLMTMQILGGNVSGALADRYGRTAVMAWGFFGSALSIAGMGAALGDWWLAVAVAAAGFFIFGTQAVMNNFTAMSYEPALRATGTGAAVAFSRVGGVIGPILIGWSRSMGAGLWATFLLLAVTQLIAVGIIFGLRSAARRTTGLSV